MLPCVTGCARWLGSVRASVTAVPGTLRIVPNESLQAILRKDYQQMEEMFPSTPLASHEILTRLEALQQRINALAKT